MKKTYMAPATDTMLFATEGIMQDALNINTASGSEFNDAQDID